jgi:hypothetical protein
VAGELPSGGNLSWKDRNPLHQMRGRLNQVRRDNVCKNFLEGFPKTPSSADILEDSLDFLI